MAHLRGCKIITLIHDLDSFRRRRLTIPHEISRLNHSDSIIVHRERMKNWLHENGIKANLEVLGVFDYLSDRQSSGKNLAASHPRVLFVGALSTFHSDFLYKLGRSPRSFDMVLYGNGFEPDKFEGQVDHKGYTRSDDLIATAEGEYGLVWYGSSLEGGVGPEGEYLQYNAPHKLSLYIRCGLPVIIWKKAALASFVEENGIGICVSSLLDLDAIITQMTKESYNALRMNVAKVNERISQGYYCKEAIQKAYAKLSPEIK